MKAASAVSAHLDLATDAIATDATTAAELFAVVDLLDDSVTLRRSLSDPSASEASRAGLSERIFSGKVQPSTLAVLRAFAAEGFPSGAAFAAALERQAVRLALKAARAAGELDQTTAELFQVQSLVRDTPELAVSLRSPTYATADKRKLLDRLFAGQISAASRAVIARAVRPRSGAFVPAIQEYLEMAASIAGLTIARVSVARPLDQQRTARLKAALEASTGKTLSLQVHVDPSIIGGINVTIGDDVIESTVAARLEDARRQLVNL